MFLAKVAEERNKSVQSCVTIKLLKLLAFCPVPLFIVLRKKMFRRFNTSIGNHQVVIKAWHRELKTQKTVRTCFNVHLMSRFLGSAILNGHKMPHTQNGIFARICKQNRLKCVTLLNYWSYLLTRKYRKRTFQNFFRLFSQPNNR